VSEAARTGLREAHAHLGALGEWLVTPSLASCGSIEACLDRVREAAAGAAPGAWVRFLGARVGGRGAELGGACRRERRGRR
jgi:predicted amidohydrolase YtcJ